MHIHRTTAQEIWKRAITARKTHCRRDGHSKARWRLTTKSRAYFSKMRGKVSEDPEIYPVEAFWSFLGGFVGILMLSGANYFILGREDQVLLLATFGASAMLLFGAPGVPFAQPRNVLGGHVVSALVGIIVCKLLGPEGLFAPALAVSVAIAVMHLSGTLHPPGGGTAMMMVTGSPELIDLGFFAALFPVASGAAILVLTALVINNLSRRRQYPIYWW
ncbi:HPP family protein [Desulfovibrio sp. OttesenSCG-928-I05]|nr:HPP family protein [Desulfovibrio sp. OttesenSCG-928-I05]